MVQKHRGEGSRNRDEQIIWPLECDITDSELEKMLFPSKNKSRSRYVELDYSYINRENLVIPKIRYTKSVEGTRQLQCFSGKKLV